MTIPLSTRSTLSVTEIEEAISSLPSAGWLRLSKVARRYSKGVFDPDDLLQEAFLSALEGRRKCPRDVDIVRFLAEAIHSTASNSFKSALRRPELQKVDNLAPDQSLTLPENSDADSRGCIEGRRDQGTERSESNIVFLHPGEGNAAMNDPMTPEVVMISEQEAGRVKSIVLAHFGDDGAAQLIVEGDMEGMTAEELYELTGLDKKAFATKRRLIRRRIERAFPEGWKL